MLLRFVTCHAIEDWKCAVMGNFQMADVHVLPIGPVHNRDKSAPVCACGRGAELFKHCVNEEKGPIWILNRNCTEVLRS